MRYTSTIIFYQSLIRRRMLKIFKVLSMVIIGLLFISSCLYAGGLSTYFVEEKMTNLQPGKTYSVKEMTKKDLAVTNTTDGVTVDIEIVPEKPVDYNLVKGYEPIPDLSWIKIEKTYFKEVGPKQSAATDVLVSIPNDETYRGKKYQVYIYSHTAGEGAMRIGVMSRLFIETAAAVQ